MSTTQMSLELCCKRIARDMGTASTTEERGFLEDALTSVRFAIICLRSADSLHLDLELP